MPILFLITVVNLIGFGMIFPLTPVFRHMFSITEFEIGYIVAAFSIGMVCGSLFFGILSDKIGRKKALFIPLLLLSVTYLLNAHATTYIEFITIRSVSGFFSGNFAVAFASTADRSTPDNRLKYMSIIGASFGLGLMFGPVIGGYLAHGDTIENASIILPFYASASLAFIASAVTLLFFKESLSKEDRELKHEGKIFKQFITVYSNKRILYLTGITILFTSIMTAMQIYMGLWLHDIFHFGPSNIGLYWSLTAIILTGTQIFMTKKATHLNPKTVLVTGFLGWGIGFIILLFTSNLFLLAAVTIILFVSMGIIQPSINANVSLGGTKNQQGLIFGLNQSVGSVGRIVGPNVFGAFFAISYNAAWFALAMLSVGISLITFAFLKR